MTHPKTFLLQKIVGYKKNGLKSLGHLHCQHIDDLSKVMEDFTEQTIIEVVQRLNNGENIKIGKRILELKS